MKRFTITEFRERYPDNDACLDKLFQLRYRNLICPKCENDKPYNRVKDRRAYQCPCCAHQIYPTQGTVFEKSTTPLNYWFYIIYLQTVTRNGVSAKEIERTCNVCYKTALRMAHQIKDLTSKKLPKESCKGITEIDQTYIGGKMKFKHKSERAKYIKDGRSSIDNKIGVMGYLERGKTVRMEVITGAETYKQMIRSNVDKSATIVTDNHNSYSGLNLEYFKHEIVDHIKDEYVKGDNNEWHTNGIENVWSLLKRTIKGTHIHVSGKHLQKYIDEVAFRYMHRDNQDTMFETILSHVV